MSCVTAQAPRELRQRPDAARFYPEFITSSWQGIFVPAGTPRDIVDRLYATVTQTMKVADVTERLAKGGVSVWISPSSAEFADFVAAETRRWAKVAKDSGATVD